MLVATSWFCLHEVELFACNGRRLMAEPEWMRLRSSLRQKSIMDYIITEEFLTKAWTLLHLPTTKIHSFGCAHNISHGRIHTSTLYHTFNLQALTVLLWVQSERRPLMLISTLYSQALFPYLSPLYVSALFVQVHMHVISPLTSFISLTGYLCGLFCFS